MLSLVLVSVSVSVVTTGVLGRLECGRDIRLPENACCVGGSVTMTTVPTGKVVNSENCNPAYDDQDLTLQPSIVYPDALQGGTYMLMFLDINSPFKLPNDKDRFVVQFIVGNIPGEDFVRGNFSRSTILAPYNGPFPLFNSEYHHYQLYVFNYVDAKSRTYTPVLNILTFDFPQYVQQLEAEGVVLCGPLSGVQVRLSFLNIAKTLETGELPNLI